MSEPVFLLRIDRISASRKRKLTVSSLLTLSESSLPLLRNNGCLSPPQHHFSAFVFSHFDVAKKQLITSSSYWRTLFWNRFFEKTLTPPHLEKTADLSNYPPLIGVSSPKQNIYSFFICIYEFLHPSA